MTATVTTIQNGILAALETLSEDDPPIPFTPVTQEAASLEIPDTDAPAEVVIGFESLQQLGKTNSTILDNYLIPITVRRRYSSGIQSDLDACHDLTEVIRDTLAAYHTTTVRVDQLLSPNPMDMTQAVGPGVFASQFVLDMDVIRRPTAIAQDTTTPAEVLSKVRKAAWDAIDNWSEFTVDDVSVWQRKFRDDTDLDELALHDPAEFEFPALAITWGPTQPEWLVNTVQSWPATLVVTAWFPSHQTTLAEYRAWQIIRAMYQSAPAETPTVSYIRAATGQIPSKNSPINLQPVELGRSRQLKALKLTCSFVLSGLVNPFDL